MAFALYAIGAYNTTHGIHRNPDIHPLARRSVDG